MEEQETPLEDVHEGIHHHAEHAKESWVLGVALSTALIAAIAAIASLLAGDYVNEAMLEQIKASDHWAHYQAKGIKAVEFTTRKRLLEASGKSLNEDETEKLADYSKDEKEIKKDAEDETAASQKHMEKHKKIATAVTWAQIAIAMSAIAVLTKQKWFWFVGLALGATGLGCLLWGVLT